MTRLNTLKNKYLVLILVCVFAAVCFQENVQAAEKKQVLLMHSYHNGYAFTDEEMRGIKSVLQTPDLNIEVYVTYMDAKRITNPEYFEMLHKINAVRYKDIRFDAVIVTDNDALTFAVKYRKELFDNVPIIFSGINDYKPGMLGGQTNITGVIEDVDYAATLELALKLRPAARQVVVISDSTTTGRAHMRAAKKALEPYQARVAFVWENLGKSTLGEVEDRLRKLGHESVVLFITATMDRTGKEFSVKETASAISNASTAPVFVVIGIRLGYGAVGGKVISGFEQGKGAAEIMLRVLNGEKADGIPILAASVNPYIFDYPQLSRWGVSEADLPTNSQFINRPESFIDKHRTAFVSALTVFVTLLILTVVLFVEARRRKRAEAAALQVKNWLETASQAARVALWDWDIKSGRLEWSPIVDELLGYEPLEVGRSFAAWENLIHPEDRERVAQVVETHLRQDKKYETRYRVRKKDGSYAWWLDSGCCIRDEQGEAVKMSGACVDISEKKVAEEEKEQLENQLRHTQKMQAVGQLAGGIAHDYNNQLTPILGFSEMLIDRLDDRTLRAYAEQIQRAAIRSRDLTQQLLAFARKGKYLHVSCDLHHVIADVINILSHSLDRMIVIRQKLEAYPATTIGDPTQIQNALLNLALNARDAMSNGGELLFHTRNIELDEPFCRTSGFEITPGAYITVSVSDQGVGMSKEIQERLFEPFFTTKKIGQGTGLGLASVYGAVKNHKGAIAVTSEQGRGSVFSVYLPLHTDKEKASAPEEAPVSVKACILIVDDEEDILNLAGEMARSLGYSVTVQKNGREAVALYTKAWRKIDLVVLDMVMPEMGGGEIFRRLKQINPDIRVVLSSGYSLSVEAQQLMKEGAAGFIQKPYKKTELAKTIRAAFPE